MTNDDYTRNVQSRYTLNLQSKTRRVNDELQTNPDEFMATDAYLSMTQQNGIPYDIMEDLGQDHE